MAKLGWCLAVFAVGDRGSVRAHSLRSSPHGICGTSLWDQLSRPLQIETLPAAFLKTFGHPALVGSHGSVNLAGRGLLELVFEVVLGLVLLGLWVGFGRGAAEPDRLVRYSAACVCAFVVFGKVLSPQFLIWLVPLVPLVRGRRGRAATALLAVALLSTQFWFPDRYYSYVYQGSWAWLVLSRDLMLLVILGILAVPGPSGALERLRTRATPRPGDGFATFE